MHAVLDWFWFHHYAVTPCGVIVLTGVSYWLGTKAGMRRY
jgi:hypothetical protein